MANRACQLLVINTVTVDQHPCLNAGVLGFGEVVAALADCACFLRVEVKAIVYFVGLLAGGVKVIAALALAAGI